MTSTSLDYIKHNRNSGCGELCVYGPVPYGNRLIHAYSRVKCKAWSCPGCGPRKASMVSKAILEWAVATNLTKFLTLTLNPADIPPDVDKVKYIRKVFAKFRVYLKRKYGSSIAYISILEFHKSGVPHLHVLVDRYIDQRWISESWQALGGGKIVFIKQVMDLHRVGRYLSKYFTKEMILSGPAGTRRYTTSRGIRLLRPYAGRGQQFQINFPKQYRQRSKWQVVPRSIEQYYFDAGLNVVSETFDSDGSIRFFATTLDLEPIH